MAEDQVRSFNATELLRNYRRWTEMLGWQNIFVSVCEATGPDREQRRLRYQGQGPPVMRGGSYLVVDKETGDFVAFLRPLPVPTLQMLAAKILVLGRTYFLVYQAWA